MKQTGLLMIAILLIASLGLLVVVTGEGGDGTPSSRSLPNDEFPQFKGDRAKTGNTSAQGPDTFKQLWSKNLNKVPTYGSPVVMYDKVYYTSASSSGNQGTVCYDMTGTQIWTMAVGTNLGTPLVYDGFCYVSTITGNLVKIDANSTGTATATWTYNPPGSMSSTAPFLTGCSSPATDGAMVFYVTMDPSGMHAVWINNGTKAWSASLGGSACSEGSPAVYKGRIYVGGGNSWDAGNYNLYCFDASDGSLIWTFPTGDYLPATPAIVDDRLYIGSMDGKLYCLDAVGTDDPPTKHWEYNVGACLYASPAVGYGEIFIGDVRATNNFHCFQDLGTSANKKWTKTVPTTNPTYSSQEWGVCSSAAISPDYVYVGSTGGDLHCLNRGDGSQKWTNTYANGWYGLTSPSIYKDKLLISVDNGMLYCIGPDVDLTPPRVSNTIPDTDETLVDSTTTISVEFNEAMDPTSIIGANFKLEDSGSANVAGSVVYDDANDTAVFTPTAELLKDEEYTFTVTAGVTDLNANTLDGDKDGLPEGLGVDDYVFSFTTAPAYPPVFTGESTIHPIEDVMYPLNFSNILTDMDTPLDQLVITEDSEYATMNGMVMELLYPNGIASEVINVSVDDGTFIVYRDYIIEVTEDNDLPTFDPIPTQTVDEDVQKELDLEDYMTDIDTPMNEFTLADSSSFTTIEGLVITMDYPNGETGETVNVSVNDRGTKVYVEFDVVVNPINDAPEISALTKAQVIEDEMYSYYVGGAISDIDNELEDLTLEVVSDYVTVNGTYLDLNYPNGILTDVLDVKVTDGEYYANTSLEVVVTPVNDGPEWSSDGIEITATEDIAGEFNLTPYVSDEDDDHSILRISDDSDHGYVDGMFFKFTYPNGVLAEEIVFTVTDGDVDVTKTATVTVTPVNDVPILTEPKVNQLTGNLTTEFTFTVKLRDIDLEDTDTPSVKVHINGETYDCTKTGGNFGTGATYEYKLVLGEVGNFTFYFSADDKDGGETQTDELVIVVSDDTITPGGGGGSSSGSSSMGAGLYIAIGVIVVIVVVLLLVVVVVVVLIFVLKGKKSAECPPDEEKPAEETTEADEKMRDPYTDQNLYGGQEAAQATTYDAYQQPQAEGQATYDATPAASEQQPLGEAEQPQQVEGSQSQMLTDGTQQPPNGGY